MSRIYMRNGNHRWGVYYWHEASWIRMSGHRFKRTAVAAASKATRLNPGKTFRASRQRPVEPPSALLI